MTVIIPENMPVYPIGVAAELMGVHPQTLRLYEEEGLVVPARTRGGTRLYSLNDIKQLKRIRDLIQNYGVNIAGVRIIIRMEAKFGPLE